MNPARLPIPPPSLNHAGHSTQTPMVLYTPFWSGKVAVHRDVTGLQGRAHRFMKPFTEGYLATWPPASVTASPLILDTAFMLTRP